MTHGNNRIAAGQRSRLFPHPFPARFDLRLAEEIVASARKQALVLDPMAGSGTTLLAALNTGREAVGVDIDPLAVQISRSTVSAVKAEATIAAADQVAERARELLTSPSSYEWSQNFASDEEIGFVRYWFPKESCRQLDALARSIEETPASPLRLHLWLAFSAMIIAKTAGVSYAIDLSHSRPHKERGKEPEEPMTRWPATVRRTVKLLEGLQNSGRGPAVAVRGDARHLPLASGSVHLVLTSPPYVTANGYMRPQGLVDLDWAPPVPRYPYRPLRTALVLPYCPHVRGCLVASAGGVGGVQLVVESNAITSPKGFQLNVSAVVPVAFTNISC